MTQEEKAIAYDEVVNKLKRFITQGVDPLITRSDVQDFFPELKESEDEQHRKWILEYLYDGLRKSDEQFKDHFKCAIAWIEKQGNKDEEIAILKDQIESLHAAIKALKEAHKIELEKQGEQKLPIEKLPFEMKTLSESLGFTTQKECDDYNKMVTDLIMSDDDNSEQKELKKEKVDNLHNYLYGKQKPFDYENANIQQKDFAPIEPKFKVGDVVANKKSKDTVKIVQILHDSYCYSGWDGASTVHSDFSISEQDNWELVEQKPVDVRTTGYWHVEDVEQNPTWSEEDEAHIESLSKRLEGICKPGAAFIPTRFAISEDEDWLKDLKDRYTWKPSKAQIEAIEDAIEFLGCTEKVREDLKSLRQQLKKLKGE